MKDKRKNNLPDFLIVGAAKSGTTSIHHYLNEFEDISLPSPKEPKYITSKFLNLPFKGLGDKVVNESIIKSYEDYCGLFKNSNEDQLIGDASADNLYYYKQAIPEIKSLLNQPKIIIVLRNPIDRAFSAYMHMRRELREPLTFYEALRNEQHRIDNNFEFIWHYVNAGLYYEQVKAYLNSFSAVKIFLFEDLKSDSKKVISEIRKFLGLNECDFELPIKRFNESGEPKFPRLKKMIMRDTIVKKKFKKMFSNKFRNGLKEKLFSLEKVDISEADKKYLQEIFREDIKKLQNLINRDLSSWLK